MYGIFVSERGGMRYARYLVDGIKTVETRGRNMLQALVGKRVAIVRTRHGSAPLVVGYVDIVRSTFCKAEDFDKFFDHREHRGGERRGVFPVLHVPGKL